MKITQVTFRTPVTIRSIETNFLDPSTRPEHRGIEIAEKGAFLIITGVDAKQPGRRKRVPMSNVTEFHEVDEDAAPAKPKEDAPAKATGPTPPPLPAARGVNTPVEPAS